MPRDVESFSAELSIGADVFKTQALDINTVITRGVITLVPADRGGGYSICVGRQDVQRMIILLQLLERVLL